MNKVKKLNDDNFKALVDEAAKVIEAEEVVLLPTETVYGLVGKYLSETACNRIYSLKRREKSKRLSVFIYDWRKLADYGVILDGLPEKLAEKYCPGAITIIAPCRNGATLGFRVPDHKFVLELLKKVDCPLYSTSANASGFPNVLTVDEALAELSGELALAVDGGAIPADSLASTVVDATGKKIKILRQGALHVEL